MQRLKARQERFCHQFIECPNAAAAAKAAGYRAASARNTGYRLLRDPRVVARIAQIQAELANQQCRELDVLLGKLETVYRRAIDDHQFSAAARAVELQAKLAGLADKPAVRTLRIKEELAPAAPAVGPQPPAANDDGSGSKGC